MCTMRFRCLAGLNYMYNIGKGKMPENRLWHTVCLVK